MQDLLSSRFILCFDRFYFSGPDILKKPLRMSGMLEGLHVVYVCRDGLLQNQQTYCVTCQNLNLAVSANGYESCSYV